AGGLGRDVAQPAVDALDLDRRRPDGRGADRLLPLLEGPVAGRRLDHPPTDGGGLRDAFRGTFGPAGQPGRERTMIDGLDLVIDGDGQVIEVNETYERIDPKYRERRPVYTQASRGNIVRLVDGKVWGPDTECGFVGVNGNLPPPKGKAIHYRRMGTY